MAETPKDPQKELERDLSELEERVDRLRASYEQYFMGYEKIEPGVQRKDVDRRFTILRKLQIRNTALRFRFNVVTQKFNTYAMYWTRVCRQIEEGTFKRHLQKAARRFGGPQQRDDSFSIDVELGDFEADIDMNDMDSEMESILAEANAHAETFNLQGGDTIPPGSTTDPPPTSRRASPQSQGRLPRSVPEPAPSSTSFAMAGRRETFNSVPDDGVGGDDDDVTPQPMKSPARHAVLPPGTKPRIQLRKREDGAPPSTRHVVASPTSPASPASPATPAAPMRPPMQSAPGADRLPPPSSSAIRQSPPVSPAGVGSVQRVPIAAPVGGHHRPMIRPKGDAPPPKIRPMSQPDGQIATPAVPMKPIDPTTRMPRPAPSSVAGPAAPPSSASEPMSDKPIPSRRPPPALPSKHSTTQKKNS